MLALLVLVSALLHALWNAILKTQANKHVAGAAVVGMAALVACVVALLLWAASGVAPFAGASGVLWSVGAGVFEAAYFVLLVFSLEHAPLAVAYTISRGLAIIAVWPISVAFLGEPLDAVSVAGTVVLCVGLAANGLEKGAGPPRGIVFSCLCGLAIAGYHLCYKQALATGSEPAAIFAVALAVAFPLNLIRLGRARFPALAAELRARPWSLLAIGSITAASFLIFLVALGRGGAGFVLTLRNTSIVFTALIGWLLGERPSRRQLVSACLVAAGAVVVGLPR
jgi:drug/metabolite transporter (DMT)-like permease